MIELITIDLDDTLWDAGPVLRRAEDAQYAWIAAHAPRITERYSIAELQAYRRELAQAEPNLRHDFTALRVVALSQLLMAGGYDPTLAPRGVQAFLSARSQIELFPEIDRVLRQLALNYRLAALTNGNTDLTQAGVAHYFEFSLAPSDTGTSKPDPRMFEAALVRASVAANAAVHVGDEPHDDIEGAHRANMASVWVNRRQREWPSHCRRAHAEIDSFDALHGALDAITAHKRQGTL